MVRVAFTLTYWGCQNILTYLQHWLLDTTIVKKFVGFWMEQQYISCDICIWNKSYMRTAEMKSNKNDPRGCERNLSNCLGSLKKMQDFNLPLVSNTLFASKRALEIGGQIIQRSCWQKRHHYGNSCHAKFVIILCEYKSLFCICDICNTYGLVFNLRKAKQLPIIESLSETWHNCPTQLEKP